METGIDGFASATVNGLAAPSHTRLDAAEQLPVRIKHAGDAGPDVFGIGEHHRKEFLDSAPTMLPAATEKVIAAEKSLSFRS